MSVCLESDSEPTLSALFLGIFVRSDVADELLDRSAGLYPHPKIVQRVKDKKAISPSQSDIFAGTRLHLFFSYAWVNPKVELERLILLRSVASKTWLHLYKGFMLDRVLISCVGDMIPQAEDLGFRAAWSDVDEWGNTVAMMTRSRDELHSCANPFMNELFGSSGCRTIQLTPSMKELLFLAGCLNLTDEEIARELRISQEAVRARWKSLGVRLPLDLDIGSKARWGQVRKVAINFARTNRTLLWPYVLDRNSVLRRNEWKAATNTVIPESARP
jgi:hypothetical protein